MSVIATQSERRTPTAAGITAGYIRLTREESILTGLSVPAQRDGITSYAQRHELPNLAIYLEERAIGADVPFEKRPAGKNLLADIKAGKISHIICRDIDRLSRDTILWLGFVAICCEHRVTLHTFSGPLALKSPSDRFASTVRAAAAQLEKDQVGDRVKRAKREMAKQGKHIGGPPPFGYTSRSRRRKELVEGGMSLDEARMRSETELPLGLVIDEKESTVVRLIFDLYANQLWGIRRIANELNRLGHRRRMVTLWCGNQAGKVINDPVLAGMVPYDEVFFEAGAGKRTPKCRQVFHQGQHQAIIPLELWQKAQKIKDRNRPTIEMPASSRKQPLVGVLRCWRCGGPMTGRGGGQKKRYFHYVCAKQKFYGRHSVGGCNSRFVSSDRLHEVFWPKLMEMVCSEDAVDRVYNASRRLLDRRPQGDVDTDALKEELAKVERDVQLWYTRHDEAGGDAEKEAAWRRIVQLTEKKKALMERAPQQEEAGRPLKAITRQQVKDYLKSLASVADGTPDYGRGLIMSLVEHHGLKLQMVDEKTFTITLSPLPPDESPERVDLQATVTIPTGNQVDVWLAEHQALERFCACGCGRKLTVERRHYWRGLPRLNYDCRQKAMEGKRSALVGDKHMNGDQVARYLGIGRTTLSRWVKRGKLPKPESSISRMLLFNKAQVLKMFPRPPVPKKT
jgi:DNA invertase Pin-like site-specific DNA recombinase/predicted DNA-binding transcriptional regulator AlpA